MKVMLSVFIRSWLLINVSQVYLPAIEGFVPKDVICTFRAFLEFCYLVRRNVVTEQALIEVEDALQHFHHFREVFQNSGVVESFSLPQQHSMKHYPYLIRQFGAPNGSLNPNISKWLNDLTGTQIVSKHLGKYF